MLKPSKERHTVYLDGTDLEFNREAFMKFRLTYAGKLLSNKPLDVHATDPRAWHKHEIRRHFHPQLKRFWEGHPFLNIARLKEDASHDEGGSLNTGLGSFRVSQYPTPIRDALRSKYERIYSPTCKYGWVPLAREEFALAVSLRVLCLRRDAAVTAGRDIDNRVKLLIDALTLPGDSQGVPRTRDGAELPPDAGENPYFYVLMSNDKLVTHLEVETDTALEPDPNAPDDDAFVRLVVSVEIRPYRVDMFNLNFA